MGKGNKRIPRPATASERSRASRLRKRRRAGKTLKRADWLWFQGYEADRRAVRKGIGKPPPLRKKQTAKAYRIRRRLKFGKPTTPEQRTFLHWYDKRVEATNRARANKRPSTMESAKGIRDALVDWFDPNTDDYLDTETWYREPRPNLPGIAIANAEWYYPTLPDLEDAPEFGMPAPTGFNANVRLLWAFVDEDGEPGREQWASITGMSQAWDNIPGDMVSKLNAMNARQSLRLQEGEETRMIIGISVMVSPRRSGD